MIATIRTFLADESGPTAVEYAVMLALIVVVCITAVSSIGAAANARFTEIGNTLSTGAP